MKPARRREGYTILEMTIGLFLSLVVVLAMGRIIVSGQRAWGWGRDKAVLQANVTEALEWMSRSVRGARFVLVYQGGREFRTFDEDSVLVHTFVWTPGTGRLQQDGSDLTPRRCTAFLAKAAPESTGLALYLRLRDISGNAVADTTRAAVRNRFMQF